MRFGGFVLAGLLAFLLLHPVLPLRGIEAQDYGEPGEHSPEGGPGSDPCGARGDTFSCLFLIILGSAYASTHSLDWCFATFGREQCDRAFSETFRREARGPAYLPVSQPPVTTSQVPPFPTLRYWDSGELVSQGDRAKGLGIVALKVTIDRSGFSFEFGTEPATLSTFPFFYRLSFDLPGRRGGTPNHFAGPGFKEDVAVYARGDAPGRYSLWAVVGGRERQIRGAVQVAGGRVRLTLPAPTVAELGLATPGVRAFFGTVGPAPERVYSRVPERGALQIGLPGRDVLEPAVLASMVKAKFDLNGDGKFDLFYLDTTGDGQINAVAFDRNHDGRITLSRLEGPGLFVGADGSLMKFERVVRQVVGKQQRFLLENDEMVYATILENKTGTGRFDAPGEFVSYSAPKR